MAEKQDHRDATTETIQQSSSNPSVGVVDNDGARREGRRWWHGIKEPGHALQIVAAAALAIAIGMAVTTTVDEVPEAARVIIAIPGTLWLRALRAVGKRRPTCTAKHRTCY